MKGGFVGLPAGDRNKVALLVLADGNFVAPRGQAKYPVDAAIIGLHTAERIDRSSLVGRNIRFGQSNALLDHRSAVGIGDLTGDYSATHQRKVYPFGSLAFS